MALGSSEAPAAAPHGARKPFPSGGCLAAHSAGGSGGPCPRGCVPAPEPPLPCRAPETAGSATTCRQQGAVQPKLICAPQCPGPERRRAEPPAAPGDPGSSLPSARTLRPRQPRPGCASGPFLSPGTILGASHCALARWSVRVSQQALGRQDLCGARVLLPCLGSVDPAPGHRNCSSVREQGN